MSIERMEKSYVPVCDGCRSRLSDQPTFREAAKSFYTNGWLVERDGPYRWRNLCPECRKEQEEMEDEEEYGYYQ